MTSVFINPKTYQQKLGDFILTMFNEAATGERLDVYNATRNEVRTQQIKSQAKFFKTSAERATTVIDSGQGTHDELPGFGTLLTKALPKGFFPADFINDAITLQTYGRIIFVMNGNLNATNVTPPKGGSKEHLLLDDAQARLTGVLARRISPIRPMPDAEFRAIDTTMGGLGILIDKYPAQAEGLRALHVIATRVHLQYAQNPGGPKI